MVKKISVLLAVVMLLACVFAACGDKADSAAEVSPIVGTWEGEESDLEVVYSFNADGTGYYEVFGVQFDMTYEVNDDEIIMTVDSTSMIESLFGMTIEELIEEGYMSESDMDQLVTTESFSYSLDGDVLTIEDVECTKVTD